MSRPWVGSPEPWTTRANPPITEIVEPRLLERLEQPVGIKRRLPLTIPAQPIEERLDALLGRLSQTLGDLRIHCGVPVGLDDLDLEHEPTRLDHRLEVLEARLLPVRLPPCDLGPVATEPRSEL